MFVLGLLCGVIVVLGLLWLLMRGGAAAVPINPKASITELERRTIRELLAAERADGTASASVPVTQREIVRR